MSKTRHDPEAYRAAKSEGLCPVCSGPRGEGGTSTTCRPCLLRQRRNNRERYRKAHPGCKIRALSDDRLWEEVALLDRVDCLPSRL